jgi:hypothetical protein
MFEGNDLSAAYGSFEPQLPPPQPQPLPSQPPPSHHPQAPQPRPQPRPQPQPQPQQAQRMLADTDMMYVPGPQPQYMKPVYYEQQESFYDRMASKRYDVLKVVSFALIIVFAISIDRFCTFYMTQYVTEAFLTKTQEALVRLSYPFGIVILIWLMKLV